MEIKRSFVILIFVLAALCCKNNSFRLNFREQQLYNKFLYLLFGPYIIIPKAGEPSSAARAKSAARANSGADKMADQKRDQGVRAFNRAQRIEKLRFS